jgi:hypothetical protein
LARILLRAHKNPLRAFSAEESLERNVVGSNSGNLVFSQAVYRLLSTTNNELSTSGVTKKPVEQINDEFDHLVIPLANAFRASYLHTLDALTDLIEQVTIPVTVVGVGAQASIEGEVRHGDNVDAATRRFTRAVLERSPSIGVRGEFTQKYLRNLGFGDEQVKVIGCPSMFMWGPDLKVTRRVGALTPQSPIALNISPYVPEMGPISLDHAERYPNLVYVAQNRETLALLLDGTYPGSPLRIAQMRGTEAPVSLDHPLVRQDRTRFFVDPRTWFDFLADYHFSFGTRIHGNISSLLAGTPALVLAHDSRTVELADYHRIPHRIIDSLPDNVDAAALYAEAEWDSLNAAHPARWETFAAFLDEHRLTHVYADGQSAATFDAALRAAPFPPPVGTLMGAAPEELYRMKSELKAVQAELAKTRKELRSRPVPLSSRLPRQLRRVGRRVQRGAAAVARRSGSPHS